MTQVVQTPLYTLGSDDKVANVLIYTRTTLIGGELVVKKLIRVSTWLRISSAPERISLYNAKVMPTLTGASTRTSSFPELNIATSEIQAYHLLPPEKDPPDFDPSEPNRHMQPVVILTANFRIDGHLRFSFQTTVGQYLDSFREEFCSVYDAKITHPLIPTMGTIQVPFLLVRQEKGHFAFC